MIDSGQVELRVNESLVGFPASTIAAYRDYGSEGREENLDAVVLGVLQFYLAKKPLMPAQQGGRSGIDNPTGVPQLPITIDKPSRNAVSGLGAT